jgi:hypothetical protein
VFLKSAKVEKSGLIFRWDCHVVGYVPLHIVTIGDFYWLYGTDIDDNAIIHQIDTQNLIKNKPNNFAGLFYD